VSLQEALRDGGRAGLSRGGNRLRGAIVVAEVALALVLLVGAGLLIQTLFKLRNQYADLQADQVLVLRTQLPQRKYSAQPQRVAFYDQVLTRVKSLPGVVSAGYTTNVPLEFKGGTSGFLVEGRSVEQALAGGLSYDAIYRQISEDYLKTMGIQLRRGRLFTDGDKQQTMRVAIINETMARQYWPGEDALGKRFKFDDDDQNGPWIAIVGVARDVRQMGVAEPVKAEMYIPYRQAEGRQYFAPRDLVVRTATPPASLAAAIQREVHAVDPDQPVSNIRTMAVQIDEETGSRQMGMMLLTIFAALALLLAMLGIYGVLAYFVAQRTPEIGVRLALGARPADVLGFVLKKGMGLVAAGVLIGTVAAFVLTRLMATLLFELSPTDPATFTLAVVLLSVVSLVACVVPARRAAKVDPLVALRYE
jgi:putative ABC transport system permease protein